MADEEFRHPRLAAIYDAIDPDRGDLDAYLALIDELGARRVLDVGCGTGTLALAARGCDVVAVDPATASLGVARAKPGAQLVRWIDGDATTPCITDARAAAAPAPRADPPAASAQAPASPPTAPVWRAPVSLRRPRHGCSASRLVWDPCRVPAVTRALEREDVEALTALHVANRRFLAPWQPLRPDPFFTQSGQREAVEAVLAQQAAGAAVPLVILDGGGAVAGALTLSSIIRGAFQSCSVGYWLAERAQGQGLATAAVREAAALAFRGLRLHRVQAETLTHNVRSQRVLERVGFERYGQARSYLHIAGQWQDNVLYQLLTPTPENVVTY